MPDREALLKNFWTRLRTLKQDAPRSIAKAKQELRDESSGVWVSGMVVSAKSLAHDTTLLAILEQDERGQDPWPAIGESLSLLYWMNEIDIHDFVRAEATYDTGDSQIYARCFLHSMMLKADANDVADWLAPFMLNVFRHGGWFDEDKEFGRFYALLLEAQVQGRWIPDTALENGLSPAVVDLLRALPDPAALPASLVAYADWRLARANGYPDASATKKKGRYAFHHSWWGVFPFELLAVQAIFTRCTGQEISLKAQHPLLETALMQPPPLVPLAETPEVVMLKDFLQRVFGSEWRAMAPVSVLA